MCKSFRSRERRRGKVELHKAAGDKTFEKGSLEERGVMAGWREIREDFMEAVAFCVTWSTGTGDGKETTIRVCGQPLD